MRTELMAMMAENVPFHEMVNQVQRAMNEYKEDPNKQSEGFLVFVMQVALMSYLMHKGKTSAKDMLNDLEKHEKVMNLFKENNN